MLSLIHIYTFKAGDAVAVVGKVGKIDRFEKDM